MTQEMDTGGPWRRRARQLRLSEERFRLLVESVIDYAIFMLDPDGRVVTWNIGAERLKGYEPDEILGQHYSVFYPDEYRRDDLPARLLAAAREHGHVEHSGWRVRKDGSRFWADVVITALREEDGQLAGFAKVTRDRTADHHHAETRERLLEEQRQAVARLEELDRWRREFIASMVHDLQTPVTALSGFAELLADEHLDAGTRAEVLARMLSNTAAIQDLIDNLRSYTLLAGERIELAIEPVELEPTVQELVSDLEPILAGRPVHLDLGATTVAVDRLGLQRVLRNLVTNAARHTPPDTEIWIRAHENGERIVIVVEDTGGGIPEDVLPRVFDRFETGTGGGMGLGLAIARRYAHLHGGELTATNVEGRGATLRLTLPIRPPVEDR